MYYRVKAIVDFVMEDTLDIRRRLPLADALEELGAYKAAKRQRDLVAFIEASHEIDRSEIFNCWFITPRKGPTRRIILRPDGSFATILASAAMRQEMQRAKVKRRRQVYLQSRGTVNGR